MNITALLSFYDERPEWLERCVRSLTLIGATRLLVIDGAYSLFEDAKPASPQEQHDAIRDAARAAGLRYSTYIPIVPWAGEVEKRNHLFHLAENTRPDWYFVIDADEYITEAPGDVHDRLKGSPFDVGAITLIEPGHPLGTIVYPTHPKFFRAIPGLRTVQNHFTYTTPDGRRLWGDQKIHRLEARHDLTAVKVRHEKEFRDPDRRNRAKRYYDTRDELGIEELPADRSLIA